MTGSGIPVNGNLVVICGPTASGKTRLGVEIARRFNGEIISCDSRQVYRGMDIGTGKDLSEYIVTDGRIPCHLIDIADPGEVYSVYQYKRDFFRVFEEISTRGSLPIMVGGSGLYIEAILRGYDIPEVPEDPLLRESLMTQDHEKLKSRLEREATDLFARTDVSSKKRIVRSLEIAQYRKLNSPAPSGRTAFPALYPIVLCVTWERSALKARIKSRLDARFEQGMVEEVNRLRDSGIPDARMAMFGMEYKHILRYLRNEVDFAVMRAALLHDIEQLAKRQVTWFRGMERRGIRVYPVPEARMDEALPVLREYFNEGKAV